MYLQIYEEMTNEYLHISSALVMLWNRRRRRSRQYWIKPWSMDKQASVIWRLWQPDVWAGEGSQEKLWTIPEWSLLCMCKALFDRVSPRLTKRELQLSTQSSTQQCETYQAIVNEYGSEEVAVPTSVGEWRLIAQMFAASETFTIARVLWMKSILPSRQPTN